MPESETSKKITRLIKALDRFLVDLQKDTARVIEAAKELKEIGKKDEEEKGE